MHNAPTSWLYPVNRTSSYTVSTRHGREAVTMEAFRRVDYAEVATWRLGNGHRTVRAGDLIWVYLSAPERAVGAVGRVLRVDNAVGRSPTVAVLWDRVLTPSLWADPILTADLGSTPRSIRRANDEILRLFRRRMSALGATRTAFGADPADEEDARQHAFVAIAARCGRSDFRNALISAYDGRCAISGCTVPDALEAVHITRDQGPASDLVSNGLLLRADLHSLFDRDLIGIDEGGTVVVSTKLRNTDYEHLQGQSAHLPVGKQKAPAKARRRAQSRRVLGNRMTPERNLLCPACDETILPIVWGLPDGPRRPDVIYGGCAPFEDHTHGCLACGWQGRRSPATDASANDLPGLLALLARDGLVASSLEDLQPQLAEALHLWGVVVQVYDAATDGCGESGVAIRVGGRGLELQYPFPYWDFWATAEYQADQHRLDRAADKRVARVPDAQPCPTYLTLVPQFDKLTAPLIKAGWDHDGYEDAGDSYWEPEVGDIAYQGIGALFRRGAHVVYVDFSADTKSLQLWAYVDPDNAAHRGLIDVVDDPEHINPVLAHSMAEARKAFTDLGMLRRRRGQQ